MPSCALRELLKCWLPGKDKEMSRNPSLSAPCMSGGGGVERCEDAGGMQTNMFFFGFRSPAPSGQSFGCLCCCFFGGFFQSFSL